MNQASKKRKFNRVLRVGAVFGLLFMALSALSPGVIGAAAGDPDSVSFTLQGCRNDGTITLPNGSGKFICPDSVYTSGNLGKGWNELDLVPYRLTADAGNSAPATQTYTVAVVVDNLDAGHPGYDVLSVPVLNTALSSSSCSAPTVGSETLLTPGLGGIDRSLYRLVTITQAKNTTCIYDYYARLALGSHLFPGSSLHANLANQNLGTAGIGSKDVSIPVKEILPQELRKDMTATQGTDHTWNVTKGATPSHLDFTNTCDSDAPRQASLQITVSWQKITVNGNIAVVTNIYAKNPASRTITVNVTDVIYSGTTSLDTASAGPTDVPANTQLLVLTHTFSVPDGTTNLNDIATATYTDKVTGVPVPGTTTATASATVQPSGVNLNNTAIINDVESISGTGLSYSVDSFSGASGTFDNGYVAQTPTTGLVSWTSASQSSNGSVTFNKTVYVTAATSTSGTLSDTATLTASDGFTTNGSASVTINADAKVSLTINKNIPNVLGSGESASFNFEVRDSGSNLVSTKTLTFGAGETSKSVTVTGLAPGSYTVHEVADPNGKWNTQSDQVANLNLPTCSGSVTFNNTFNSASARVKKVTVPAGSEAGWQFTLTGPGVNETVTTTDANFVNFTSTLSEGSYTITETPKAGFDQTSASAECSFTVNYPADASRTFSCTYTNTQRGHIIVKKFTNPSGSSQSFAFTPSYNGGTTFTLSDGQANDSGALVPGSYSVSETVPTGWDLTSATCDNGNAPGAITLGAGQTITCTFTNTRRGTIIVKKVTVPNTDTTTSFSFTAGGGLSPTSFSLTNGGTPQTYSNLIPNSGYSVAETPLAGWDLTAKSCDNGNNPANITVNPGQTVTCTFTNTQRGKAKVVKTVKGAAPSATQAFTFQLRQGASTTQAGTILETQIANAANGGVINFTTSLVPGTTYQICEVIMPGWLTNLGNFVPGSYMPPDGAVPDPTVDNSILCGNFTVAAGETRTFTVDNTPPPGGRALTIGFWKNWASCTNSNGKQKPVLDQTLAKAELNGITIGTLVLHGSIATPDKAPDCLKAVNLLNKTTIDGKKKMASDPAFNMAAQLLAAKLNIVAGAGTSAAVTLAIADADKLLAAIHFNGLTHDKMTASQTALANKLAKVLDDYNNDRPVTYP